jgi:hypothetical protein
MPPKLSKNSLLRTGLLYCREVAVQLDVQVRMAGRSGWPSCHVGSTSGWPSSAWKLPLQLHLLLLSHRQLCGDRSILLNGMLSMAQAQFSGGSRSWRPPYNSIQLVCGLRLDVAATCAPSCDRSESKATDPHRPYSGARRSHSASSRRVRPERGAWGAGCGGAITTALLASQPEE